MLTYIYMASEIRGCSNNSKKMYEGEAKYYIYSTGDWLQGCLVSTTNAITINNSNCNCCKWISPHKDLSIICIIICIW